MNLHKLDNPVWFSLTETHKAHCIEFEGSKFYNPDYSPFGGFSNLDKTAAELDLYSNLISNFYVVGDRPSNSNSLRLQKDLACNQMLPGKTFAIDQEEEIIQLQEQHQEELFTLVNLVQPGYFKRKTPALGNYYGIFKNNALVAVSGERMQMNSFIEISAVVTHPNHAGRGYAKKLVAHTANKIFEKNKTPYLHVAGTNVAAITLYEKLGFKTRRKISFWNFIKK